MKSGHRLLVAFDVLFYAGRSYVDGRGDEREMATETRQSTTLTLKARAVLPLRQNWCIRSAIVEHADVCESVRTVGRLTERGETD
jgi:hypothetical protein